MKTFESMGFKVPGILLPKKIDIGTWSVVACDQYTQDRDYWKKTSEIVGEKPSTLNLILPEVYLGDGDKASRIEKIRSSMKEYLSSGVFEESQEELVYLERKTAYGRVRHGLVCAIDLETYEWKPFSKALIRATEATIVDRIPPRMEIRRGAPIESPHIMLLVNDPDKALVEGTGERVKASSPLYQGDLMMNSGSITGWAVKSENDLEYVRSVLEKIYETNKESDGSSFLFAVGDGNHSLATAKAVWDEYKKSSAELSDISSEKSKACSVRYALVEIVNIYDSGLTFEPIHRVVFNMNNQALVENLKNRFDGKISEEKDETSLIEAVKNSSTNFGFVYMSEGKQKYVLLSTERKELAVSFLQPALDEELKSQASSAGSAAGATSSAAGTSSDAPSIDYIHGEKEVMRLGKKEGAMGILLPPVCKESFFSTISSNGPLPRKSFSMGEADEKRFYLECRNLFPL